MNIRKRTQNKLVKLKKETPECFKPRKDWDKKLKELVKNNDNEILVDDYRA